MSESIENPMVALTDDKLVETYIALRDKRDTIKQSFKIKDDAFKGGMDKIEAELMGRLNKQGLDSIGAVHGTAYKSTRTNANIADWDAFTAYITESGDVNMLQKRANKTTVTEFLEAHGELPPGITLRNESSINIRRKS